MGITAALLGLSARMVMATEPSARRRALSILIFHRVHERPDAIFPLEAHAAWFDAAMGAIARGYRVLRLGDAVRQLQAGALPPRALSITFDDGYADNHDVALPILQSHGLSACFFIATGFLDGGRMFNDTVIECVRRSPLAKLDLTHFGLGVLPIGTPQQQAAAISRLLPTIKYMRPSERDQALADLRSIAQPVRLPNDLMMTSGQVQALHRAGMEIGAHTVHHPILASLSTGEAEQELRDSRDRLQSLVAAPVTLFAYPNGQPDQDYRAQHAQMARALGFAAAVTTASGVARAGDDLFQLPRFTPWSPKPARWAAELVLCRRRLGHRLAQTSEPTTSQ